MLKKYFENYESQEDEDYNPTAREEAIYRQEHEKKKKTGIRSFSVNDLWNELQQEHLQSLKKAKPNEQQAQPSSMQLAQRILNSDSIKPDKRIMFAGKQYIMNEETGQLQIAEKVKPQISLTQEQEGHQQDPEVVELKKTKIAYHYLNHVMRAIYNRSRKINAVGKSKLDWKGFVKQQGIEHKLSYHRKGGVIKDMQFLKNTS